MYSCTLHVRERAGGFPPMSESGSPEASVRVRGVFCVFVSMWVSDFVSLYVTVNT